MSFVILNRRTSETIFTEVTFTFPDGSQDTIDVAHFEPQTEDEILQNIENRYQTELQIRGIEY